MAEVIVDTCVRIALSKGALDAKAIYDVAGSQLVHVPVISLGELEFGAQLPSDARERAQRPAFLRAIERMSVLTVTPETARSFGLLATMMKAAGRSPGPRYNDLRIAAQAHEHHLPLLATLMLSTR